MKDLKTAGVKLVSNALWTLRDSPPPNLMKADLLHNIFLGIMEYVMGWSEGFLTVHHRLDAFDDIWAGIQSYPGQQLPREPHRQLGQVPVMETVAIMPVLLAVFTALLRRKSQMPGVTGGQQ